MNIHRSQIVLLAITIVVAIIAVLILRTQFSAINVEQELIITPWVFGIALIASLLQELLNPVFAGLALRSVGQSTRYFPQLLILLFSTSANSTVPVPAGIPLRAFLQKQFIDIPYTKSASGLLIETIIGYSSITILAIISSYIWLKETTYQQIIAWKDNINSSIFILFIVIIVSVFIVMLLILGIKRSSVFNLALNGFHELLTARLWPILGMFGIVAISLVLTVTRVSAILFVMGITVPPGPLLAALLIARLAGVASFIPMGLGVRDASLASLLILIGVPLPQAIALAAIDRVIMTLPYLIGGIIATHILGKKALTQNINLPKT